MHGKPPPTASGGGGGGTWTEHRDIDMCGQGDAELVHNWKKTHSVEQLKRIAEQKGYSAVTVSSGTPSFGHAAFKKFSYQLTPAHCKPISSCCKHPCTIYIFAPGGGGGGSGAAKASGGAFQLSDMSGSWYTYKTGGDAVDAGIDAYEFVVDTKKKCVRILRHGKQGKKDEFSVSGAEIKHAHGHRAQLLPNGDIHWLTIEGGKYSSRRRDRAPPAPPVSTSPVKLEGWTGYNARFNGEYVPDGGNQLSGRPVLRHTREGWCRMYVTAAAMVCVGAAGAAGAAPAAAAPAAADAGAL